MNKIRIGVLGATGAVGQRFAQLLANHPYFDLQVLALQTDITRIITFQMARELSTRTYPEIGVPDP